ncbi:hypothetical protein PUMCH_002727 [Australozyma saopauloensis]|uniref:candidapepsin n=1 Tax=Australozyma saopauloensis TaxID=291208 RepID=A0AAX4HAG8_9ASCO|nr:hypothetical protein PUMCH_002727 [[Candida] saopauloensis]
MRFLLPLSIATLVSAVLIPQDEENLGYVKLRVKRSLGTSHLDRMPSNEPYLSKRDVDGSWEMELKNNLVFYETVVSIGSDNQKLKLVVSTGSSDMWVPGAGLPCPQTRNPYKKREAFEDREIFEDLVVEDLLEKRATTTTGSRVRSATTTSSRSLFSLRPSRVCFQAGTFNNKTSTSFRFNTTAARFEIYYPFEPTDYAFGTWGRDTVTFGDIALTDFPFAVANKSYLDVGYLGIGPMEGEVSTYLSFKNSFEYENFPMRLKSMGAIKTNSYSLYMDLLESREGSLLFGAVDKAKYSGTLQLVPFIQSVYDYYGYLTSQIVLSELSINGNGKNIVITDSLLGAVLESGTTFSKMPAVIVESLALSIGGTYNSRSNIFNVDCKFGGQDYNVTFDFSGVKIQVPLSDLVMKVDDKCLLTIKPEFIPNMGEAVVILGDNFLRSAYVVYDLENYEIGLAQAKYTDEEDVEVITDRIPNALKASAYSQTSTFSFTEKQRSDLTAGTAVAKETIGIANAAADAKITSDASAGPKTISTYEQEDSIRTGSITDGVGAKTTFTRGPGGPLASGSGGNLASRSGGNIFGDPISGSNGGQFPGSGPMSVIGGGPNGETTLGVPDASGITTWAVINGGPSGPVTLSPSGGSSVSSQAAGGGGSGGGQAGGLANMNSIPLGWVMASVGMILSIVLL